MDCKHCTTFNALSIINGTAFLRAKKAILIGKIVPISHEMNVMVSEKPLRR